MSRAYRIRVVETERRYLHVEDRVCTDVELLPILPKERLSELLAAELQERGFEIAEGVATRQDDGVRLEVDLATGRLSARAEVGEEVERSASTTVLAGDGGLPARRDDELRERLRQQVDRSLKTREKRLQKEVTEALEAKLRDVQREVDEVGNRVAGAALKEKAKQLGEIVELLEDETGSLTIKVKV